MNEVIGAQIVSVPMSVPVEMAERTFQSLLAWLGGAFGGITLCANLCVAVAVGRPRSAESAV
jgi:protein-histidine pros-kinase